MHHDLYHLNYDAKQLLQAGVIKLPSKVLTAVQNRTINLDQKLVPYSISWKNKMIVNEQNHDLTQAIA